MLNFFRPRDRSLSLCDSLLQTQRRRKDKLTTKVHVSIDSQGNSDISRAGVWLSRNKEKSQRRERYSWPHFPVIVVIRIPWVFLFSQHQEGNFVNKGIAVLSHLPGLLPRITVCLLPLLCILEALNLCKHFSNLFLQLLQKKSIRRMKVMKGKSADTYRECLTSSLNHWKRIGQMVATSQGCLWNGHCSGVTLLDSRWKQWEREGKRMFSCLLSIKAGKSSSASVESVRELTPVLISVPQTKSDVRLLPLCLFPSSFYFA